MRFHEELRATLGAQWRHVATVSIVVPTKVRVRRRHEISNTHCHAVSNSAQPTRPCFICSRTTCFSQSVLWSGCFENPGGGRLVPTKPVSAWPSLVGTTAMRGLRSCPSFIPSHDPSDRRLVLCASRTCKKVRLFVHNASKSMLNILEWPYADTRQNCHQLCVSCLHPSGKGGGNARGFAAAARSLTTKHPSYEYFSVQRKERRQGGEMTYLP